MHSAHLFVDGRRCTIAYCCRTIAEVASASKTFSTFSVSRKPDTFERFAQSNMYTPSPTSASSRILLSCLFVCFANVGYGQRSRPVLTCSNNVISSAISGPPGADETTCQSFSKGTEYTYPGDFKYLNAFAIFKCPSSAKRIIGKYYFLTTRFPY